MKSKIKENLWNLCFLNLRHKFLKENKILFNEGFFFFPKIKLNIS